MLRFAEYIVQRNDPANHFGECLRYSGVPIIPNVLFSSRLVGSEAYLKGLLDLRCGSAEGDCAPARGNIIHRQAVTLQPLLYFLNVVRRNSEVFCIVLWRQPMPIQARRGVLLRFDQGIKRMLLHFVGLQHHQEALKSLCTVRGANLKGWDCLGQRATGQRNPNGVVDGRGHTVPWRCGEERVAWNAGCRFPCGHDKEAKRNEGCQ